MKKTGKTFNFCNSEQLIDMENHGILHGTILIIVDKKCVLFGLSLVAVEKHLKRLLLASAEETAPLVISLIGASCDTGHLGSEKPVGCLESLLLCPTA